MEHLHQPKVLGQQLHTHSDDASYHHRPKAKKQLLWAMALTGSMMVVEGISGFLTGSLALLSDAGHMLSHFFALSTSLFAIVIASKRTTNRFSFGLYRVEVLSALLNGLTLLLIVGYILYESYHRFLNPKPIAAGSMFFVAILGLLVNLVTVFILHRAEKGDINMRSAFLHMLADTASSFGVVGGAVVIYFTGRLQIDPILSVVIACLIAVWSWGLLKESILVLLESSPRHIDSKEVVRVLKAASSEIVDVHDLHVWEVTSQMYSLTAHILVDGSLTVNDCERVRKQAARILDGHFHITHTNFQFEGTVNRKNHHSKEECDGS